MSNFEKAEGAIMCFKKQEKIVRREEITQKLNTIEPIKMVKLKFLVTLIDYTHQCYISNGLSNQIKSVYWSKQ